MRCYNSSTRGEKKLDYGGWVLRRWPYDQPRRIPTQLIGLAIINIGVASGMSWSAAAFSVQ